MFRRPAWFAADRAPHPFAGVAIGILMAALASVLRARCDPILGGQAPFLLHIPAVVVASWFGGLTGRGRSGSCQCLSRRLFLHRAPVGRFVALGRPLDGDAAVRRACVSDLPGRSADGAPPNVPCV